MAGSVTNQIAKAAHVAMKEERRKRRRRKKKKEIPDWGGKKTTGK